MPVGYRPNSANTARFLRTSGDLRRACRRAANEIMDVAIVLAPVEEGNYVLSMSVQDMIPTDRVGCLVFADDEAAAPLEFGTSRVGDTGRRILSRAAEIAGYDVDASGA